MFVKMLHMNKDVKKLIDKKNEEKKKAIIDSKLIKKAK